MKLQYRLIVVALGALLLGLALHLVMLLGYEQSTYRGRIQQELQGRAEIVGLNSMAALEFRDVLAATENLNTLKSTGDIRLACLYLPEGGLLAKYAPGQNRCPELSQADGGQDIQFLGVVRNRGDVVGHILLRQQVPDLWQRLPRYGLLMGSSALVETLLVLVLVVMLRRRVVKPVNALAALAKRVTDEQDFRRRIQISGHDEIASLGHAFNRMLAAIDERDAAIQESNQLMQALVDHAPATISIKSADGRYLLVNEEFARISGHSQADLLGQRDEDLFDAETVVQRQQAEALVLSSKQSLRGEEQQAGRTWLCERFPLINQRGEVSALATIATDISALRDMQAQLALSVDEITRLNESLEARVEQRSHELKQAMNQLMHSEKLAALGSLVAGVAHELNTPIGVVVTVATSMADRARQFAAALDENKVSRSAFQQFLQDVQSGMILLENNSLRAGQLISDFKQVAVDQTSMRRREFRLDQLIEDTVHTLGPLFKHTPHRIELGIPPDIHCNSYPGAVEQILTNLVQNALIHGLAKVESGVVHVRADLQGPVVCIEVCDDGAGILPEHLPHLFEPFFTTRLGEGGSGLGLYIVYNLASSVLGGEIEAVNIPGGGACFTLTIPLLAPAESSAQPESPHLA